MTALKDMFNWYSQDMDKALEGMLANASSGVIDSMSAFDTAGVEPGHPVIQSSTEGMVKMPTTDVEAAKVIGVAVHQHKEPSVPFYAKNDTIPVMSFGDIYVQLGDAVASPRSKAGLVAVTENGATVYRFNAYTDAIAGSRAFTVTTNGAASTDTVTIGGVTLTAGTDYTVGANVSATATAIAAALNKKSNFSAIYSASASGAVITVTEEDAGGSNTPAAATYTGTIVLSSGTAVTSTAASGIPVANATILDTGDEGDLVRLRIRK